MAEVIHTIKGNEYLYEHYRDGDKIRSKYIGPVGKGGKVRKAQHGGGAPLKVTQQTGIQKNKEEIVEGKTINNNKGNSSIGTDKPKEKSTMELIEFKQELESVYSDIVQKHKEYKNSEDGTDEQYAAMQRFNNALERRDELRMKIREIETGVEQTMGGYDGISAKDIDTTPMKRDPEHEKRIRDTDEWQRKHDSD